MKLRLNWDALVFCLAWAALALIGFRLEGIRAGLALSIGLFPVIMLASAFILSRTGSFQRERIVRWSILIAAAIVLAMVADVSG